MVQTDIVQEPQQAFEEELIESPELERRLTSRQELADQIFELKMGFPRGKKPAKREPSDPPGYNELNKEVKGIVKAMELDPEKRYRCGLFTLTAELVDEKDVEFHQSGGVRWKFAPIES